MSERRSSRTRKRVDYAKFAVDENSDDDFAGSTPPSGPPQKKRNCDKRTTSSSSSQEMELNDHTAKALNNNPSNGSPREASSRQDPAVKVKCITTKDLVPAAVLTSDTPPPKATEACMGETAVETDVATQSADSSPIKSTRQKMLKNNKATSALSSEDEMHSEASSSVSDDDDDDTNEPTSSESEDDYDNKSRSKPVKGIKPLSSRLEKNVQSDSSKLKKGGVTIPLKTVKSIKGVSQNSPQSKTKCTKSATQDSPQSKTHVEPSPSTAVTIPSERTTSNIQHRHLIKVAPARLSTTRLASSGTAGLRLGLSRNARVKSLHPAVKVGPH